MKEEMAKNKMSDEDYDNEDGDENDDSVDNTNNQMKHKAKKVEIYIRNRHEDGTEYRYSPSVDGGRGGCLYTSVRFNGSHYGAGGGCIGDEEIQSSVEHYKKCIEREGDIPIIKDYREIVEEKETKLDAWFGG